MLQNNYYVYVLLSLKDGAFYIGFTRKINQRLKQHLNREVVSTKNRLPFKLIHYEYFSNKDDAISRERYLKSGYRHEQLKSILKQTLKNNGYKYL